MCGESCSCAIFVCPPSILIHPPSLPSLPCNKAITDSSPPPSSISPSSAESKCIFGRCPKCAEKGKKENATQSHILPSPLFLCSLPPKRPFFFPLRTSSSPDPPERMWRGGTSFGSKPFLGRMGSRTEGGIRVCGSRVGIN